jgi:hypothetical protein
LTPPPEAELDVLDAALRHHDLGDEGATAIYLGFGTRSALTDDAHEDAARAKRLALGVLQGPRDPKFRASFSVAWKWLE